MADERQMMPSRDELRIFPGDFFIEKNYLISKGIIEALIHTEGRYTVHKLGGRFFNALLNSRLIQLVKSNEYGRAKIEGSGVHWPLDPNEALP